MNRPARPHDPLRLEVERFAREGARLSGCWPLGAMTRLLEACDPDHPPGAEDCAAWTASGERRRSGAADETWLCLELDARLTLTCQRCLGPVETALDVERRFRFVDGEAQAAALDAAVEEDVLASSSSLDLRALAEDELLLALPIVARHQVCPEPLRPARSVERGDEAAPPNPFAALAGLRSGAKS